MRQMIPLLGLGSLGRVAAPVHAFQNARGFPRLSVLDSLLLYRARQPGERPAHAVLRSAC